MPLQARPRQTAREPIPYENGVLTTWTLRVVFGCQSLAGKQRGGNTKDAPRTRPLARTARSTLK